MTSDDYFATGSAATVFDFAFIDGLHLSEQALRDFINVERHARPGAALVIDDVLPNHPAQATRTRSTRAWTGDVWRLKRALEQFRPDLFVAVLDTYPSGSLLVAGLDPTNGVLDAQYAHITASWKHDEVPPASVLARSDALDPTSQEAALLFDALESCYALRTDPAETVRRLNAVRRPALSIIVISYNMARELPRTIRSLAAPYQRDISPAQYEIIVIDNGSTQDFDDTALRRIRNNVHVYRMENPTRSPVRAINWGLTLARGDLVGVCIDGARMASPGLVAGVLAASRLHDRPVIGTLAFHLGPKVQMQSVLEGYNQHVEDALLATSGWEEDGYNLFDISVFAGSSSKGWFTVPNETNALFMRSEHWRELGGYDPGFEAPGGGLANLDMWRRACLDPTGSVIMMLGEATFHQVHGGIATNALGVHPWEAFHREYVALRGEDYRAPAPQVRFFGALGPKQRASLEASLAPLTEV